MPRRSILAGGVLGGIGLAMGLPALATPGLAAEPAEIPPFDWDTGNASFSIVVSQADPIILSYVGPSDAPIIIRLNVLIATAMYDAIAPYHPTAVGVYSNLGRRPSSESATNRNKNIALVYAAYQVFLAALPITAVPRLRAIMTGAGLDPDADQANTTTPIGIGNLAGKAVVAARAHDGCNMLGDVGWGDFNRQPYRDYTGYEPVNTPFELRDPSRWSPAIVSNLGGTFKIQKGVTPQLGRTQAHTFGDVRRYLVAPPRKSDYRNNRRAYREQAEEVLARSAALTDELKLKAELFNDKLLSLGLSIGVAAQNAQLTFDEILQLNLVTAIAEFDALIACWYNKYHYDAIRPATAIKFLYGRDRVTAWGGIGQGTVSLPGENWSTYLPVADHPEYPSGSALLCQAHIHAAVQFLGTDALDLTYSWAKGTSRVEPGITPHADLSVHYTSWADFAGQCGQSRINGGVHFSDSVTAGAALGGQFGDMAYEFLAKRINGQFSDH